MRGGAFLRKAATPEVAEAKLRAATDIFDLEDAWSLHCDQFPDESSPREHLLTVYYEKLAEFREKAARYLRSG